MFSINRLIEFSGCNHATALSLQYRAGADLAIDATEASELVTEEFEALRNWYAETQVSSGSRAYSADLTEMSREESRYHFREAMKEGYDIIWRAQLSNGKWSGTAPVLRKVRGLKTELGDYGYQVVLLKVARSLSPAHAINLVLLDDMVLNVQGVSAGRGEVVLGNQEIHPVDLSKYREYTRNLQQAYEHFVGSAQETRPVPGAACTGCRWSPHCKQVWEQTDSLFQVANIRFAQVKKLEAAGIKTMKELAVFEGEHVPAMDDRTLATLKVQARLQDRFRETGKPEYVLRPHLDGHGFDRLPDPQNGDLFYDIEGFPFFKDERGETGLEYLHGVWFESRKKWQFRPFWAHDRAQEKTAFIALMKFFKDRVRHFPSARIYHYAKYEITALRKMSRRHKVGMKQLEGYIQEGRFVDLYEVVSGGIQTSEPAYSIKNLERFYMSKRKQELKNGGASIEVYHQFMTAPTRRKAKRILQIIQDYNEVDCVSTKLLRDWLVSIKTQNAIETAEASRLRPRRESSAAAEEVERQRLTKLRSTELDRAAVAEFHDLMMYFQRERKPAWWNVFVRRDMKPEELTEDLESLAQLRATGAAYQLKQSIARDYCFPKQETKLFEGSRPFIRGADGLRTIAIEKLDVEAGTVTLKWGAKNGQPPDELDLIPEGPVDTSVIEEAVEAVLTGIASGERPHGPAVTLLERRPPLLKGATLRANVPLSGMVDYTVSTILAMDGTTLAIQGPPGTGKTYVISKAIIELVKLGKRVAVASNSHKAIDNVLLGVAAEAEEQDMPQFGILKRGGDRLYQAKRLVHHAASNNEITQAHRVVGGTMWAMSDARVEGEFDYLFVDEAGQVGIAAAIAMSRCASNLVLVGDPQQLPQVVQGVHPGVIGESCLRYILGDHQTIPDDQGIFLPTSRRMHPSVASFVSEIAYEGRLTTDHATRNQAIEIDGLVETGVYVHRVDHEGNSQMAVEEVAAIKAEVARLLQGTYTDRSGNTMAMRPEDILVVAPYNLQVNALRKALPGISVGTVDKFQGQEAPVCLISMTTSSASEMPRDLDFLFSINRLNVAVSRAKAMAKVFVSPRLFEVNVDDVRDMQLVNALCKLITHDKANREAQRILMPY